jgi:hypothetical protein
VCSVCLPIEAGQFPNSTHGYALDTFFFTFLCIGLTKNVLTSRPAMIFFFGSSPNLSRFVVSILSHGDLS